jgi:hypothetical protein
VEPAQSSPPVAPTRGNSSQLAPSPPPISSPEIQSPPVKRTRRQRNELELFRDHEEEGELLLSPLSAPATPLPVTQPATTLTTKPSTLLECHSTCNRLQPGRHRHQHHHHPPHRHHHHRQGRGSQARLLQANSRRPRFQSRHSTWRHHILHHHQNRRHRLHHHHYHRQGLRIKKTGIYFLTQENNVLLLIRSSTTQDPPAPCLGQRFET